MVGGEIMRSIGEKLAGLGDWFKEVIYKIGHDPLWMGVTIGFVVLVILVFVLKRRVS
jgi:hypothetical protein